MAVALLEETHTSGVPIVTANVLDGHHLSCKIGYVWANLVEPEVQNFLVGGIYIVDAEYKIEPEVNVSLNGVMRLLYVGRLDKQLMK